jgi:hypothetical protein
VVRPCKARPCPRPQPHSFIRPQQKDVAAVPSPSPFSSGHVRDSGVCRVLLNAEQPLLHAGTTTTTTTTSAVPFLFTTTGHSEQPSWTSLAVCDLAPPPAAGPSRPLEANSIQRPRVASGCSQGAVQRVNCTRCALRWRTRAEQRTAATSLLAASVPIALQHRGQLCSLALLPHAQKDLSVLGSVIGGLQDSPIDLARTV